MATLQFNENDFFFKNVNAPIPFDAELCKLSDSELEKKIKNTLNLPNTIVNSRNALEQKVGQCIWRKAVEGDSNQAVSWKMVYAKDSAGQQTCKCVADSGNPTISTSNSVFSTSLQGSLLNTNKYICRDSIQTALSDLKLNDINLDPKNKEEIISKSIAYYKSVCSNKEKAAELMNSTSKNQNSDLKYDDIKTFYNREYLNRINLGIGIITTIGIIYYTFTVGSVDNIIPVSTKPTTV